MQKIVEIALRLLARREHSQKQLQQKLLQRGYPLSDINAVLDKLENDNLLNNQRFMDCFIRSKRQKGDGPLKICAQLQKYGIDLTLVQKCEEWLESSWEDYALAAKRKRFGEAPPKNQKERLQQYRFLQQRGFTHEQIILAFRVTDETN